MTNHPQITVQKLQRTIWDAIHLQNCSNNKIQNQNTTPKPCNFLSQTVASLVTQRAFPRIRTTSSILRIRLNRRCRRLLSLGIWGGLTTLFLVPSSVQELVYLLQQVSVSRLGIHARYARRHRNRSAAVLMSISYMMVLLAVTGDRSNSHSWTGNHFLNSRELHSSGTGSGNHGPGPTKTSRLHRKLSLSHRGSHGGAESHSCGIEPKW